IDSTVGQRSGMKGRISLGTGATACIYLLPPILKELRKLHPGLEIVVSTGYSPDILRALADGRIDAALVTMPAAGRGFETVPVMLDEMVAVFPPGAGLAAMPVPAAVLADRPLVLAERGGDA